PMRMAPTGLRMRSLTSRSTPPGSSGSPAARLGVLGGDGDDDYPAAGDIVAGVPGPVGSPDHESQLGSGQLTAGLRRGRGLLDPMLLRHRVSPCASGAAAGSPCYAIPERP